MDMAVLMNWVTQANGGTNGEIFWIVNVVNIAFDIYYDTGVISCLLVCQVCQVKLVQIHLSLWSLAHFS